MDQNKIEDSLKGFLQNPLRCWAGKTPAITNYRNIDPLVGNYFSGIHIFTSDTTYDEFNALGGRVDNIKRVTVEIQFYTRDTGNTRNINTNIRNINNFFNRRRNNVFYVAQLVKLNNKTTTWELEDVNNELDNYNIYGDLSHPDLTKGIDYFGYKVKNEHGEHFLYRIPQTRKQNETWNILDLNTHLNFHVHRFRGNFVEVLHNNETYLYEFIRTKIFNGKQFISLEGGTVSYSSGDQNKGTLLTGNDFTIVVTDYEREECPQETETFETNIAPSHPYSPVPYTDKFLIAAVSGDSTFTDDEWLAGNKVKNSLEVSVPSTTTDHWRGFAYSADRIDALKQVGSPFGSILPSFEDNGIQNINGILYYTIKSRNSYYPVSQVHPYVISPDEDFRDAFIVSYVSSRTVPTIDDFTFSGSEEFVNPNSNSYDLSISANPRSYVAIGFTGGNLNRIMDGSNNIRNHFTPAIDQPFQQKIINNKIFNIFISDISYFVFSTWTIFY